MDLYNFIHRYSWSFTDHTLHPQFSRFIWNSFKRNRKKWNKTTTAKNASNRSVLLYFAFRILYSWDIVIDPPPSSNNTRKISTHINTYTHTQHKRTFNEMKIHFFCNWLKFYSNAESTKLILCQQIVFAFFIDVFFLLLLLSYYEKWYTI